MKVSDEIDALRTMGLPPIVWLVVPRLVALVIVMPLLVLIADVVGVIGGLVVAAVSLDVSPSAYLLEIRRTLEPWDVQQGLIKSVPFAITIVLIACQQGFAAAGGAESVGRRTTSTVVTNLFALVVLDALFTLTFRLMGK
jgi:phospholipid/cholesterol/gamma-HCH transport system permease protein